MHFQIKLYTIILISTLFFTACSKDKKEIIENKNIESQSGEVVSIKGINAKTYSWRQVSGIDVILIDSNTDTLSFIAPDVQKEEILTFELQALITSLVTENIVKKDIATVTIKPNTQTDETDTTIPSHEDTTQDETSTTNTTNTTSNKADAVKLKSIKLTLEKNSLNVDENTTLKVVATYQDNTIKDVTNEVEWIYADKLAISIQKHTLKTNHKDTNIFLQAKYNNKLSNRVALEIYIEINGHRLPPEPNPTINNATLLGVDSNNNGVRDDVERWIYEEYKEKHPIHIDIAMQEAKANKKILEIPEKALEIHDEVRKPLHCQFYYKYDAKYFNEPILIQEDVINEYFTSNIYFNTQERKDAYLLYDSLLSGGAYDLPPFNKERKAACDFNTSKYED